MKKQITWIRILSLTSLLVCSLIHTGCNTTAGIGKDIAAAGNKIDETATKVKNKM